MSLLNKIFVDISDFTTRRRRTSIVIVGATTLIFFIAFLVSITLSYRTKNISEMYQLSQNSLNLNEDLLLYSEAIIEAGGTDNPELTISLYKDRIEVLMDKFSDYMFELTQVSHPYDFDQKARNVLSDTYESNKELYFELIDETNELLKRPSNSYGPVFRYDYLEKRKIDFHAADRSFILTNRFLSNELRRLNQLQDIYNVMFLIVLLLSSFVILLFFTALTRNSQRMQRKINIQKRKSSIVTREAQISVSKFFANNEGRVSCFELDSVAMNILGVEREDLDFLHNSVVIYVDQFIKKYTQSRADVFNQISHQVSDNEVLKIHVTLSKDYGSKVVEFTFFTQDSDDDFNLFAVIRDRDLTRDKIGQIDFDLDSIDLPRYGYWKVDLFKEERFCIMDRHVASMNDIQLNDTNTYTFDERRESILKANGEKRFQEIFDNYMKLEYDEISEIEHEYRLIDNHGNPIVVKEYVRTVKNSKNKPIQMIGLITDVTAQKEQLKKIHDLAYIDPVTGYRNRFALTEDYNTKLKNGFGLLMKLDNYTDVIKYCGYGYADKFSKEMMAKNYLGTSPLISKYKLTYNTFFYYSTAPLNEVINTVSTMLKNINVHHTIGNKMIDLKFRVVILEDIHDNIDDFLREIEYSYTICQDLDKDLVFADEDLLKEYRIKKNFEDLIRKAIANDEFFPYFQPKADVNTGKTYGAEALARWMLDGEIIPPIEFIPYLESVGLISDLDLMIMNKAMHQAKEWIDNKIVDDDFRISFNLSIDTVEKTDLISLIDQAVVDIGIGYHNIEMEVTETMVVTDSDKVLNELRGLKGRGVTISIDDFSAGNSSLVSICKFPCDIIKIDSKLLWSVEDSPINQEVISLVSALGKRIEKKIICEGVENLNQKRILEAEGVELAQGYYYAKPLSPKDFIDFITKDVQ